MEMLDIGTINQKDPTTMTVQAIRKVATATNECARLKSRVAKTSTRTRSSLQSQISSRDRRRTTLNKSQFH